MYPDSPQEDTTPNPAENSLQRRFGLSACATCPGVPLCSLSQSILTLEATDI